MLVREESGGFQLPLLLGTARKFRADASNFRYQKRTPLPAANSRPLRWVVVRNPRANPHEHSIPLGQEPRSGTFWHLASCHSTRISGPLIPPRGFPHALMTKVPPAQVARAARSCATSQLVRRVEHATRRGIVKRLLRYRPEGHFRTLSCKTRICNVAAPWHKQWGVPHDLYARMRELSLKFEGVETVEVGTLSRRVRRERRISPHLKPKSAPDRIYHISTGSSNCACQGDLVRSRNAPKPIRSQR